MTNSEKLFGTQFILKLHDFIVPFLADHLINLKPGKEFTDSGSDYEVYLKRIWVDFNRISDSLENLDNTPKFLSVDPFPAELDKVGIDEFNYFKYHYEVLHIKIISVIEYCSYIINSVYRLGIPTRKCTIYSIFENRRTEKTKAAEYLKELNKTFENFRQVRNTMIHEGTFDIEKIESIDTSILKQDLVPILEPIKKWYEERKEKTKKEIRAEAERSIDLCGDLIVKILNALEGELELNVNFLKKAV